MSFLAPQRRSRSSSSSSSHAPSLLLPSSSSSPAPAPYQSSRARRELLERIMCDDQFLLTRCSDYQWRDVYAICVVLREILRQPCSDYSLIQAATAQLLKTDSFGNTCLGLCCHYKPPPTVIAVMLEAANAADSANSVPLNLIARANNKGAIPLNIACGTGASPSVLQLLLQQPQAGSTVSSPDNNGCSPFHGLVRRYEMLRKVRTHHAHSSSCMPLHRTRFQGAGGNYNNVDAAVSSSLPPPNTPVDSPLLEDVSEWQPSHNSHDSSSPLLEKFCQKVELLLQSAWKFKYPAETMPSLLHGAAVVAECLPPVLTDMILRCHSQALLKCLEQSCTSKFTLIRTPLEVVIRSNIAKSFRGGNSQQIFQQKYFINQYLKSNPSAASLPSPVTGRLPFVEAVACGFAWHESDHTTGSSTSLSSNTAENSTSSTETVQDKTLLQTLFHASPQALGECDPLTGLPVVALANKKYLSTIFALLQLSPLAMMKR